MAKTKTVFLLALLAAILIGGTQDVDTAVRPAPHRLPGSPLHGELQTCIGDAAQAFRVPADVLHAIIIVESGGHNVVRKNRNGSIDVGVAQINSVNFPFIEKNLGMIPHDLKQPCQAVYAAAWLLAEKIEQAPYFEWGVGAYHSKTPSRNVAYQAKVFDTIEKLKNAQQ